MPANNRAYEALLQILIAVAGADCDTQGCASVAGGTTAGMQEVEKRMEQLPRTPGATNPRIVFFHKRLLGL